MIGGLVASIWGSVMELEFLWVAEPMRGIGIGSGLLRHAEGIAKECGCTTVTTTTYSFPAPEFYRKFGYISVATLDGFPDGIRKDVLLKELSSEPVGEEDAGHQG
jgi:GNAT superfamily N-acetyltransferase